MYTVPVKRIITTIREALILDHGTEFLKLSENDQNELIYWTFVEMRKEAK
jgi:hypothetical protein